MDIHHNKPDLVHSGPQTELKFTFQQSNDPWQTTTTMQECVRDKSVNILRAAARALNEPNQRKGAENV